MTSEITLRDLVAWTDVITFDPAAPDDPDPLDREVDWVISARSTAPMLHTVRGGELVLLPHRVVNETGLTLPLLLQELATQPVAGVVLDTDVAVQCAIPLLRTAHISSELESDLNRMITSRRGDLLRAVTTIERIVTEHRAGNVSPETLLRALADHLGFTFTVLSPTGRPLLTTTDGFVPTEPHAPGTLFQPLRQRRTLVISGLTPQTHALGRLALARATDAVQHAFDHEASTVQDHTSRTRLVNQALLAAATDGRVAPAMLRRAGIQTDGGMRVALAPPHVPERSVWPLLRSIGTPVDAGTIHDHAAWLVQLPQAPMVVRTTDDSEAWIAVSAAIRDPTELRQAVRQATFVADARGAGLVGSAVARFDDVTRMGALRLLYDHWGEPMLDEFIAALVGPLLREDRRGQLRATLRAYLAYGGTQRATAEHLGIHRNTLTYRLRQIRQLLTVDPDDSDARLGLHLALLASELPPPRPARPARDAAM